MNEDDAAHFDALLKRHLRSELDPRLGRARAGFEARRRGPGSWRWRRWAWGMGVGAAAAVVAIVWIMRVPGFGVQGSGERGSGLGGQGSGERPEIAATPQVTRLVSWRDYDEGTMLLDAYTPVRRVRREIVETSQWYDPKAGQLIEMNIPRQEVMLISMRKQ